MDDKNPCCDLRQPPGQLPAPQTTSNGISDLIRQGQDLGKVDTQRGEGRQLKDPFGNFPGGPVVRAPHFHCKRCGFTPWSAGRTKITQATQHGQKKKKKDPFGLNPEERVVAYLAIKGWGEQQQNIMYKITEKKGKNIQGIPTLGQREWQRRGQQL